MGEGSPLMSDERTTKEAKAPGADNYRLLEGAALMAGVQVDVEWDEHPMTLPVRNNEALVERFTDPEALTITGVHFRFADDSEVSLQRSATSSVAHLHRTGLAAYYDLRVTPSDIAELCVAIEPTDNIMFRDLNLFNDKFQCGNLKTDVV